MRIFGNARDLVISSAVFLFFGAPAHSFELNGAWANDPSICDKIFVKQNAKLAMTKDADNYGSGFIVEGNQVRGKIASCNIKSRKEDAGLVHVITSCGRARGPGGGGDILKKKKVNDDTLFFLFSLHDISQELQLIHF